MPLSFDERLDMLQEASKAWVDLKRMLDRLKDADLARPNTIGAWSGKDLIAHLGNWEEVGLKVIREMDAGKPERWPHHGHDINEFNAGMLEPWRSKPLDEVRRYFEHTHFALMDLAETSPSVTPDLLLGVTKGHYAEHRGDLQHLLERK